MIRTESFVCLFKRIGSCGDRTGRPAADSRWSVFGRVCQRLSGGGSSSGGSSGSSSSGGGTWQEGASPGAEPNEASSASPMEGGEAQACSPLAGLSAVLEHRRPRRQHSRRGRDGVPRRYVPERRGARSRWHSSEDAARRTSSSERQAVAPTWRGMWTVSSLPFRRRWAKDRRLVLLDVHVSRSCEGRAVTGYAAPVGHSSPTLPPTPRN
jgi:hypothetical protein